MLGPSCLVWINCNVLFLFLPSNSVVSKPQIFKRNNCTVDPEMGLMWIKAPCFFLYTLPWLFGQIRKCAMTDCLGVHCAAGSQQTPANLTGNCTDIFPRAFPQASTADSNNSKLHLRWGIWDKNDHYKRYYRVYLLGDSICCAPSTEWSEYFTLL